MSHADVIDRHVVSCEILTSLHAFEPGALAKLSCVYTIFLSLIKRLDLCHDDNNFEFARCHVTVMETQLKELSKLPGRLNGFNKPCYIWML